MLFHLGLYNYNTEKDYISCPVSYFPYSSKYKFTKKQINMAKTIVQKVVFKNTTSAVLYSLYVDAKKHSMISGGPAVISARPGSKFSVHGGYISGKNLQLVKDKVIVQTWRAMGWDKEDADSIFIIHLEPKGKDVVLLATHANVPDKHVESISKGWHSHYWNTWKQYIAGKEIIRPKM